MNFGILLNFITSLALGALIGIERQRGSKSGGFAGIRTFILISLLGSLSSFLYQELAYEILLPTFFITLAVLIIATYVISALKGYIGITEEISAYIVFLLGFMIMFDDYRNYALIFGVIVVVLLSFKDVLHKFAEETKDVEWNDTLKFALIAFVILPLLPEEINLKLFNEGQFYNLNLIYPREIWLLVVFVCAISFIGYILVKIVGEKKGVNLIGAMGGLVSSTAVTQSMSSYSKSKVKNKFVNHKPLVTATLIATIVQSIRVFVISVSINKELSSIIIPILVVIILGVLLFLFLSKFDDRLQTKLKLNSPFKLKPALILGSLYALLTFLSKLSFAMNWGKSGILIASAVTGFFDIDPVILTVSSLSANGDVLIQDAICAILLSFISNQITKSIIALTSGSKKYGLLTSKILLSFVIIILIYIFYIKLI